MKVPFRQRVEIEEKVITLVCSAFPDESELTGLSEVAINEWVARSTDRRVHSIHEDLCKIARRCGAMTDRSAQSLMVLERRDDISVISETEFILSRIATQSRS